MKKSYMKWLILFVLTICTANSFTSVEQFEKSFGNSGQPGQTVTLEFVIRNFDSNHLMENISFTDDLDACCTGLLVSGPLPSNPCGPGSQLTGTSTLTLTGGNLPTSGQETFSIQVLIPAGATPGTYTNTTSMLSFTIEGGGNVADPASADLTVDATLPVELSSFSAESTSVGALIKWTTESETDNLGFILERAAGTRHALSLQWDEIASYQTHPALTDQGNTSQRTDYTFTDVTAQSGMIYQYRLSDADIDGNITVLDILEITMRIQNPDETQLEPPFPNPFNPQTKISYKLAEQSSVTLNVYDVNGRLVSTLLRDLQQSSGSYSIHWLGKDDQGQQAASGAYILRLIAGDVVTSQKVILMR
ncbi:T9SS type A sorting domain-containing protein [candidate division KSB1 bacterium]|nr:T9SS type A sorting domain-containing protein [candidate division KSB1 bacterium]